MQCLCSPYKIKTPTERQISNYILKKTVCWLNKTTHPTPIPLLFLSMRIRNLRRSVFQSAVVRQGRKNTHHTPLGVFKAPSNPPPLSGTCVGQKNREMRVFQKHMDKRLADFCDLSPTWSAAARRWAQKNVLTGPKHDTHGRL